MQSNRNALVAAVRQELAEARGTARAVLAAAEAARVQAQGRRRRVREAYATCMAQLSEARNLARRDIVERTGAEATTLARNLASLAAQTAPGAAGTGWRFWSPTEPDRVGRPGMLRIGTVSVQLGAEPIRLPALVPLLDHAHLNVLGDERDADAVITGLLLRVLGTTRAGDVRISVHDPERLGGTLAGFAPLQAAGLLTTIGPGRLGAALDELVDHICRVNETGRRSPASPVGEQEPWRIVCLLFDPLDPPGLPPAQRAQLDRIARTGAACGVHLIVRGLPLKEHPAVERIVARDGWAVCDTTGELPVRLDGPPPPERVTELSRGIADRLRAGPATVRLADLEPDRLCSESSARELTAPLGPGVGVTLGDDPPHALIAGPPGSGRTNVIMAWTAALAARYGPDELALYLADFDRGDAFARFVPGHRDPAWLPQLRLAAVNAHDDPEFGLALLRHLSELLRARTLVAKRHYATTLADLRAEAPEGRWPRVVAVLDNFPVLLTGDDEAATLLEDLARRGRALGVHLVLAGPDDAVRALPGLRDCFALRIALPRARGVLHDTNLGASLIPRHHAVVNAAGGAPGANEVVQLPDALDRAAWRALQRKIWQVRPESAVPPRLFDGSAVPRLPDEFRPSGRVPRAAPTDAGASPGAILGERLDVAARPARLRLGRMPGRNLAVLGSRRDEACDVLASAALSLAAQGPARFSIACLDPGSEPAAARLAAELPLADRYGARDLGDLFTGLGSDGVPHYVLGYALDTAAYRDAFRGLLDHGPEQRIHLLGWWRSVAGLRASAGSGSLDAVGAWVALDVRGPELSPLCPQPGGPAWRPRRRRALFFDRSVHRSPEVIIPYEVNSDHT